ncbi:MAG: hypothetical protein NTW38_09895 [Candidatus Aminicenantes bacterium]|nr:hypothetical protein [Candidatus Aminicenantes bacterium]
MKIQRLFGVVLGCVVLAGFATGQEAAVSVLKTALIEQEYEIAKTSKSYVVFDFEAKIVALKAKGFVLKEWPIAKVRRWGRLTGLAPYPLERKSAIHEPKRKDITPNKTAPDKKAEVKPDPKKTSGDLDILELDKMPVDYTLWLPDQIRIIVRPHRRGLGAFLDGAGRIFSKGIARRVKTIFRAINKRPFTDIEIIFAEDKDAKGVYWSFFEGQKCILYWPD